MKTRNLLLALGCAAALTACTTNDEPTVAPAPAMRAVTLNVEVNEPADTRVEYTPETAEAVTTYKFAWTPGDKLSVYYNDGTEIVVPFTIDDSSINGKSASFNGSLPDDYVGDVTIVYAGSEISQDEDGSFLLSGFSGRTTEVAKDLAARTLLAATATVTEAGKLPDVKLNHQLSYLLLKQGLQVTQAGLTLGEGDPELLLSFGAPTGVSPLSTGLFVKDTGGDLSSFSSIYVNDGKLVNDCLVPLFVGGGPSTNGYYIVGRMDGSTEEGGAFLLNFTYEPSKIYVVEANNEKWPYLTVPGAEAAIPLTIEALAAGNITIKNPLGLKISYQKNGGKMVTSTEGDKSDITITDLAVGDKVQLFGDNKAYANMDYNTNIDCSGTSKVYGNIMSLISSSDYSNMTALENLFTFYALFANNTGLTDASGLILPATTLADYCYTGMFSGCTSLTTAPELPATTLTDYCYSNMFYGCTALTSAPALPATSLANLCYTGMFYRCTSLTTAPELPATTLEKNCYAAMFLGCTKLTAAPTLPAASLVEYCYEAMFSGCTKLSSVTCLAEGNIVDTATTDWLKDVAETGTFTKAAGSSWPTGTNGIPSGWSVRNYGG